jgi:hypothetical protein
MIQRQRSNRTRRGNRDQGNSLIDSIAPSSISNIHRHANDSPILNISGNAARFSPTSPPHDDDGDHNSGTTSTCLPDVQHPKNWEIIFR